MSINRRARAALLASLALPIMNVLPTHAAAAAPQSIASSATTSSRDAATIEGFKATLSNYGSFVPSTRYGEVWVPGVTPPGWHPYPACQWVYAKGVGWYFNDDSEWSKIVHHYGRWQHEDGTGWFWIPDAKWSPGWVSWRMNEKWIGWAPLPPDEDLQTVSANLDTDKLWTFMDAAKFGKGCDGVTTASNVGAVRNVSLFTLPRGVEVDVEIVPLWTTEVITQLITIIIDHECPPPPSPPPPPPPPPPTPPPPPPLPPPPENPPPPPPLPPPPPPPPPPTPGVPLLPRTPLTGVPLLPQTPLTGVPMLPRTPLTGVPMLPQTPLTGVPAGIGTPPRTIGINRPLIGVTIPPRGTIKPGIASVPLKTISAKPLLTRIGRVSNNVGSHIQTNVRYASNTGVNRSHGSGGAAAFKGKR